jgi:hypothetical protein
MKYRIVNFRKFQNFHDRKPPWIKLYRDLLDNMDWFMLSPIASKSLINLWLLGSESFGNLPDDFEIGFRLRLNQKELELVMKELIKFKFVEEGKYELKGSEDMSMNERIRETNGFASRYIKNETKTEVLVRDNHKCQSCGSDKKLEFDHIVPVSKGGSSEANNLQLLCRSCNRSKRALSKEEFATQSTEKNSVSRSLETETETEAERERKKHIYSVEFEKFWDTFPPNPRKTGKVYAYKIWTRKRLDEKIDDIVKHLLIISTTDQWKKDQGLYIPMPSTYLSQERFDMEIPKQRNPWDNAK